MLYVFVDNSAVAYVRFENYNVRTDYFNSTHSEVYRLVFSKNRPCPAKVMTIPCFELMEFFIGIRIAKFLANELGISFTKQIIWCDSQCFLTWISSNKLMPVFASHATITPAQHQLLQKIIQNTIDAEIKFNDVCVSREVFCKASNSYEIPLYHVELPDMNNTQVVEVMFDDFDVELSGTAGVEQQFVMEVTVEVAEVFPLDFTFVYLSATTDVRLSCMGELNADDDLKPGCVFMSGDVCAVIEFTTTIFKRGGA